MTLREFHRLLYMKYYPAMYDEHHTFPSVLGILNVQEISTEPNDEAMTQQILNAMDTFASFFCNNIDTRKEDDDFTSDSSFTEDQNKLIYSCQPTPYEEKKIKNKSFTDILINELNKERSLEKTYEES